MKPLAFDVHLPGAVLLLLIVVTTAAASAPPATQPVGEVDRQALAAQCDRLLSVSVRTSSGIGWGTQLTGAPAKPGLKTPPIDGRETALIGMQLFWAGQTLGQQRYTEAAYDAARGLSIIQLPSGQVRGTGLLVPGGGPKEPIPELPDRRPTLAALGLWLMLIEAEAPPTQHTKADGKPARDERLVRPAAAAARWLATQQNPGGAWVELYPADAPRGKGQRLIRLDTPGYRDATLAMLLAGEVLDNRDFRFSAERALDQLILLRIPCSRENRREPTLWPPASTPGGDPVRKIPAFVDGVDLLGSRRAMETCGFSYLISLKAKGDGTLREASAVVASLPKTKDLYHRYCDRTGKPIDGPPQAKAPVNDGKLFPDPDVQPEYHGQYGLNDLLALAEQINAGGGDKVAKSLSQQRPLHLRMVETFTGLSDSPFGKPSVSPEVTGPPANLWKLLHRRPLTQPSEK